ncbi:hypothetical protein ONE63_011527 [Megalurothrips usitatus]|uniref:Integrase catalytic domain-containing protein n=1 Tax=Megalurothrips usitatus TaxID=439358 RepID=A0AAV7WZ23_9NEOP|nr:hypothetical protein ONE63_011527 [Megalurothrips usitatus]
MRFFIKKEDLYDALVEVHRETGHDGRNKVVPALAAKYVNVSQDTVALFMKLCGVCLTKKAQKKGVVLEPNVHCQMNSRCQVDLIDEQSKPDGNFEHVPVYQDHLTKFCTLRALTGKTAAAAVNEVLDIFSLFEAPCIPQSDNGREFANQLVTGLREQWPPALKAIPYEI